MDTLVKSCTVVMAVLMVLSAVSEIRKEDCKRSQLYSLFFCLILIGIPFGRVWGLW